MPLDLLGNLINDLGGCVDRVVTELREDAFLATIPLTVKGERQQWMKVELVAADAPRSHALSWHCAAARRSWSESQTIEAARPMTSRPSVWTATDCRSGWSASIPTSSGRAAC